MHNLPKNILIVLLSLFCLDKSIAQTVEINFNCNIQNQQIFLYSQYGNELIKKDSVYLVNQKAVFSSLKLKKGLYYIVLNDTNKFDFLLNPIERKIVFNIKDCKINKSIEVVESDENKLFWEYKYFSKEINDKIKNERVQQSRVPKNDIAMFNYYEENVQKLNNQKLKRLNELVANNSSLFFSESVMLFEKLNDGYADKMEGQKALLKLIPFNKVEYLNTQFYPAATMLFLQNYTEYNEEGFKNAVDKILDAAKVNDEVYNFHLNFLIDLFKRVGPDVIFDYLIETRLLDGACSTDEIKNNYAAVIENYKALQLGSKAPDFELVFEGEKYNLKRILGNANNRDAVLFFYSSHCQFCHQVIDKIESAPEDYSKLSFVFISLDSDKDAWLNYSKEHKLPGINICDLNSWKSDAANKFMVHKTPSFFRINSEGIIVYKGSKLEDLVK